jgi:serine/threonine protein kinase
MQSIHKHMIVHADLKPANLVIVNGSVKIIDFGISKDCGANTTRIHRDDNTGTVNYMSPEAIANGVLKAEFVVMVFEFFFSIHYICASCCSPSNSSFTYTHTHAVNVAQWSPLDTQTV